MTFGARCSSGPDADSLAKPMYFSFAMLRVHTECIATTAPPLSRILRAYAIIDGCERSMTDPSFRVMTLVAGSISAL